jgi:hypothetical protein
VKLDEQALDHRRFWDAMDRLTQADLAAIETQIYGGMIDRYGLDLASVALGMTNVATYLDLDLDFRASVGGRSGTVASHAGPAKEQTVRTASHRHTPIPL